MNWHVLVIMQSFISHRFLFIGNFGKSPKNWPSHLTTTGFFSTWLGVGDKYVHIFVRWWLVFTRWKQQHPVLPQPPGEAGDHDPTLSVSSSAPQFPSRQHGTRWQIQTGTCSCNWELWAQFGSRLARQALGQLRRGISAPKSVPSSGLDANPSGLQLAAECSSVTGKSSRFLCCCHRQFKYLHFWQQFSLTSRLRKTRPRYTLPKDFFFPFFFLFKQVIFLAVFRTVAHSLQISLWSQDVLSVGLALSRMPCSREILRDLSILTCTWCVSESPLAKAALSWAAEGDVTPCSLLPPLLCSPSWVCFVFFHFALLCFTLLCMAIWGKHAQAMVAVTDVLQREDAQVYSVFWSILWHQNMASWLRVDKWGLIKLTSKPSSIILLVSFRQS